jgi:hypothetical protein
MFVVMASGAVSGATAQHVPPVGASKIQTLVTVPHAPLACGKLIRVLFLETSVEVAGKLVVLLTNATLEYPLPAGSIILPPVAVGVDVDRAI